MKLSQRPSGNSDFVKSIYDARDITDNLAIGVSYKAPIFFIQNS